MKRHGWILTEVLLYLFLTAALAAAVFPMAGRAVRMAASFSDRHRCFSEGLFAADYMVDKIRNNESPVNAAAPGITNSYGFILGGKDYMFSLDNQKLYLSPGGASPQPVTGETDTDHEKVAFTVQEGEPLFSVRTGGLVTISYAMVKWVPRRQYEVSTSIFPYSDYFQVGKVYE